MAGLGLSFYLSLFFLLQALNEEARRKEEQLSLLFM